MKTFQVINGFRNSNPSFSENIGSPPATGDARHLQLAQFFGDYRMSRETITHWFQSKHGANQE